MAGSLFTTILDCTTLKAYLAYFMRRSAATIVVSKVNHTLQLLAYALAYFKSTGERHLEYKVLVARQLVRSVQNAAILSSRLEALRKDQEELDLEIKIFLLFDLKDFKDEFQKHLILIMRAFRHCLIM